MAVVNTHRHLDHLGCNALLREAQPKVTVIASSAGAPALQGRLADSRRDMLDFIASGCADAAAAVQRRIDIALTEHRAAAARHCTDGPCETRASGRPLQIGFVRRAVTAADLWVYDADRSVLAAGDLVTLPAPFLDTACPPGWRAALAQLDRQLFTRLVPGHGAPMTRADFATWRGAFEYLLACASGSAAAAACVEGWVDDLGALLTEAQAPQARRMVEYYLARHLRADTAQRDRFRCPVPAPAQAR